MPRKRKKPEQPAEIADAVQDLKEHIPGLQSAADIQQRPVSYAETRRAWEGPGDTGLTLVTTRSPDKIGIRFPRGAIRTPDEKRLMEDKGLAFDKPVDAWMKRQPPESQPDARRATWDTVQALYDQFVEERRAREADGRRR